MSSARAACGARQDRAAAPTVASWNRRRVRDDRSRAGSRSAASTSTRPAAVSATVSHGKRGRACAPPASTSGVAAEASTAVPSNSTTTWVSPPLSMSGLRSRASTWQLHASSITTPPGTPPLSPGTPEPVAGQPAGSSPVAQAPARSGDTRSWWTMRRPLVTLSPVATTSSACWRETCASAGWAPTPSTRNSSARQSPAAVCIRFIEAEASQCSPVFDQDRTAFIDPSTRIQLRAPAVEPDRSGSGRFSPRTPGAGGRSRA